MVTVPVVRNKTLCDSGNLIGSKPSHQRKGMIRLVKDKRCFNCLGKGHLLNDGNSIETCLTKGCKKQVTTQVFMNTTYQSHRMRRRRETVEVTPEETDGMASKEVTPVSLRIRGNGEVYL